MNAVGFPWRQLWVWLTAPRLSWLTFVLITLLSAVIRSVTW